MKAHRKTHGNQLQSSYSSSGLPAGTVQPLYPAGRFFLPARQEARDTPRAAVVAFTRSSVLRNRGKASQPTK